jgi:hypothetical protein
MPRPAHLVPPLIFGALLITLGAQAETDPPPAPAGAAAATVPPESVAPTPPVAIPPPAAAPASTPLPAAAPPAVMAAPGELAPLPPPPEKPPFYRETWFWAVVGVVVLTATMITIGLASQGPSTPKTDLGNMRAF